MNSGFILTECELQKDTCVGLLHNEDHVIICSPLTLISPGLYILISEISAFMLLSKLTAHA